MPEQAGERPEKYLSGLGLASRREIARWIEAGRLAANGHVLRGGERIRPADRLTLDGRPLRTPRTGVERRVILYNKPVGEIVSRSDPEGRPSVFDALPPLEGGRWVVVGRLDVTTSGLLLFTTDGKLAARLMHPRYEVSRTYMVRVHGEATPEMLAQLQAGIELEDGLARFDSCEPMGWAGSTNRWYRVSLREGRNREVRRMFESLGLQVSGLRRIGYGSLDLPRSLAPGRWQELDEAAIRALDEDTGTRREPNAKKTVEYKHERSTANGQRKNIKR
jgi:23S rRNA pseudouridine2605 synthase